MSFYFRIAILIPIVLGAILLVSDSGTFKLQVLGITLGFMLILCLVVAAFAWWRPKNLVYGESGHRAELKMGFGTEQHSLNHRELATLQGTEAPKELKNGGS